VRPGSRAPDVLAALAERTSEPVSKQAPIERVWPDTFVEEANLRLSQRAGCVGEVRELPGGVCERFTEAFVGGDCVAAGRLPG
jgi:hypothetical protein